MEDIFNIDPSKLIKKNKVTYTKDENIYSPKVAKGEKYTATLKFLPNPYNTEENILKKYTNFLINPANDKKMYVDCPTSVDEKSIIREIYVELYNSDNASDNELANSFKRKMNCYSLVQIIEDNQNPDLVGKIMVYKYPIQIYKQIENLINDEDEPNNPFDIFEGRSLKLKIENKTFYNYDTSTWKTKPDDIILEDGSTTKDRKEISQFINKHKIDIGQYAYKPWTDEIRAFVKDVIINTVPSGTKISKLLKANNMANENETPVSKSSNHSNETYKNVERSMASKKPSVVLEDDMEEDEMEELIVPKNTPKKVSKIDLASLMDDDDDE